MVISWAWLTVVRQQDVSLNTKKKEKPAVSSGFSVSAFEGRAPNELYCLRRTLLSPDTSASPQLSGAARFIVTLKSEFERSC
jgi:hypothetical protein